MSVREASDREWQRPQPSGNGAAAPEVEPLRVIDPRAWQGQPVPQRSWIVPEWVPCGVATGIYGPPGYGKTLILQQLMTSTALVRPWLGLSVARARSIGFFCEDDEDELHRRQEAINASYEVDYKDLGAMRLISRLGEENILMTFNEGVGKPTPLYFQLIEEARAHQVEGEGLIVGIDTVADTFGGDQNNMGHARQFVQFGLAGIARALGPRCAVIAAAHPSQSGRQSGSGESGSVQWDATFRSRAYLDNPKANGAEPNPFDRVLTRKKANYAARTDTIDLVWHNGVFLPKYESNDALGSIIRRNAEEVFLDELAKVTAEGRYVSESNHAPNYAPKIFSMRPDRQNFGKTDFERAMQTLFAVKKIRIGTYQRSGHDHACIVRTPEE